MSKPFPYSAVGVCLIAIGATIGLASAARSQAPDLATVGAKTIEVEVTQSAPTNTAAKANGISVSAPKTDANFGVTRTEKIDIEAAGKIRIEGERVVSTLPRGISDPSRRFLFIADGKARYDYNGERGTYFRTEANAGASGTNSPSLTTAGLDVALGLDGPTLSRFEASGADTLDDKPYSLYVYRHQVATGAGTTIRLNKLWIDTATRLPARFSQYITADGATSESVRLMFTGWKIDQPTDESLFVWRAPVGATLARAPGQSSLLPEGTPAPDFTAYDPGGKPVKLSDYKGKVVVIAFWSTWSGSGQRSMQYLDRVYRQVKNKNVVILAICVLDTKYEFEKWFDSNKEVHSFPRIFDPAGRNADNIAESLYWVTGIPTEYVVGADGNIAASNLGDGADGQFLETALRKLEISDSMPEVKAAASR